MLKFPEQEKELKSNSTEKVLLVCDYCGLEFDRKWRIRCENFKKAIVKKDACPKCRYIKREETSLIKYGTKVPSQNSEVRKKASLTKGGSGKSVIDYHDQIIEMYNQKDMSINYIANKLGLTPSILHKYILDIGLDTRGDPQLKAQRTTKEKYGKEHFLQTATGQLKLKQSLKEKYGDENPYNNKEYKDNFLEKSKKTCFDKYGVEYILQDDKRKDEFEQKRKQTRIKNGQLIYNGKTISELAKEKDYAITTFYQRVQKFGLDYAIKSDKHHTDLELIIKNLLERLDIKYSTGFSVGKRIADFYLPNNKIIIETDGLYWHSDRIIKSYRHHSDRRQSFIDADYIPLFFREDEINEKLSIIESIILNKVGKSIKIGARECEIKEISKDLGKRFLENNHLMGNGQGRYFGLLKSGILYAGICIKNTKDGHEISRFCNKKGYSIIGGFSRLVKFAVEKIKIEKLITFIDLRYGQGNYLKDLGFEFIDTHLSFKWTNNHKTFHRLQFPGNSGYEQGLVKIWDCGQAKYVLQTANLK